MFPARSFLTSGFALLLISAAGCGSDVDAGREADSARCVYNQAYQENYAVDAIDVVRRNADDCYVLVDGLDPAAVEAIPSIKTNGNDVACYTSVGTGEVWRDDFAELEPFLVSEQWDEWEGEYFVSDTSGATKVLKDRITRLGDQGCDWVEFDNMDWATSEKTRSIYGIVATQQEAAAFSNELCDHVHSLGMLCMAKNLAFSPNHFDGVTFESYQDELDWWDPAHLETFVTNGLPVIIFHYDEPDCESAKGFYRGKYGDEISVLCEDPTLRGYLHKE